MCNKLNTNCIILQTGVINLCGLHLAACVIELKILIVHVFTVGNSLHNGQEWLFSFFGTREMHTPHLGRLYGPM